MEIMTQEELIIKENDKKLMKRINSEIDSCGMAYKIKDSEGNKYVFVELIRGVIPLYIGKGGRKHIFNLIGYEIIEKYCSL